MMKVQKRDGRIEDFDRQKIKGGILRSGGTEEQAESITTQIELWAQKMAINGIISSLSIKEKLFELLGPINPAAKTAFENYKKP